MNQEFEAIVMGNYAELCIMWRIARVKSPGQAKDFDDKLKSLESVIEAFGMAMPDLSEGDFGDADQPLPQHPPQQAEPEIQAPQPRAQQGVPAQQRQDGGGLVL